MRIPSLHMLWMPGPGPLADVHVLAMGGNKTEARSVKARIGTVEVFYL